MIHVDFLSLRLLKEVPSLNKICEKINKVKGNEVCVYGGRLGHNITAIHALHIL